MSHLHYHPSTETVEFIRLVALIQYMNCHEVMVTPTMIKLVKSQSSPQPSNAPFCFRYLNYGSPEREVTYATVGKDRASICAQLREILDHISAYVAGFNLSLFPDLSRRSVEDTLSRGESMTTPNGSKLYFIDLHVNLDEFLIA